jgi:protein SCO1
MIPPGRRAGPYRRRPLAVVVLALVTIVVAACTTPPGGAQVSPVWVQLVTQAPLGVRETAYDPPRPAPSLRLTDQDGKPFDLASLSGRPVFVYFGYTHCPDVCPTTLADLRAGIRKASLDATVVFVTIDPARDDAAAMKQYVDYYQSGWTGLTGNASEIATAASAWGVTYKQLPSDSANGYSMAHSADAYLVDPSGTLRYHLFFGAGSDLIAEALRDVAAR